MYVQFSPIELQLLTETLVRHTNELLHEIARTDDREFKRMLLQKLDTLTCLQSQLIEEEVQLSMEDCGVLDEVLDQSERSLYFEIARTDDREFRHMLQQSLERMESAHCKLTEARVAA